MLGFDLIQSNTRGSWRGGTLQKIQSLVEDAENSTCVVSLFWSKLPSLANHFFGYLSPQRYEAVQSP